MHNRTRVIVAAALTAALAGGGTAAAMASTAGAKPGTAAKTASVSSGCTTDADLAAQLGVSQARLVQAERAVKTSFGKAGAQPTDAQIDAALASALGVSQARVHQALASMKPCKSDARGSKAASSKAAGSAAAERAAQAAFTASVARQLHVSPARVSAALRPIFAAGHGETSSPAFVAAARSLGVSAQQLMIALMHAKESLAAAGR
jgi:hypothetical protein